MANSIGTRPIILTDVTADPVKTGWCKVESIVFDDYPLDTDSATLVDAAGNVIAVLNGAADLTPVILNRISWVHGLRLSVITAGAVRIYID